MNADAHRWIERLQLTPHPEGGYYREIYHSPRYLRDPATVEAYGGARRTATSIYFLLPEGDVSRLHRLRSDELWYFHHGRPVVVHLFHPDGRYEARELGLPDVPGREPQVLVPAGTIFGAELAPGDGAAFALVGCMVTPGFDFEDFELVSRDEVTPRFPAQKDVIARLT
ncbi:cupin domain-containing protein [Alicyclobacillus sendaiensis]|uniref:cupin domain-containing protein n=1 Tax=Alicyclobacillus sendaiensis TaxID=192387 RepID=UPI0026F45F62|nr:cupin domain-containing protein [Alicyclobacillus sendaiensis]